MIFAVLGDIKGDEAALECAINAIEEEGILTVVCTGNVAAGAADPNGAIDLLRARDIPCAMGEADRLMLRFQRKRQQLQRRIAEDLYRDLEAAHETITSDNLEYLRGLHRLVRLEIDGQRIHVCHGSPASTSEVLSADSPWMRLQRHREDETPDALVCGGHPEPWYLTVDGTLFVGPGYLRPDEGHAGYVIVNTEASPWTVEARRVACG